MDPDNFVYLFGYKKKNGYTKNNIYKFINKKLTKNKNKELKY